MGKKKIKKTTIIEEITDETTRIIAILDRSGSMSSIIDDAKGGFNEFIKEQQELDGEAFLTTLIFDHEHEYLHEEVDINKVKEITNEWTPRGTTALNDAIAIAVEDAEKSKRKFDKTLVVIVTDGMENASKKTTTDKIKEIISKKESEDWQFVYLAANQDAFSTARNYGFSAGNTSNFNASGQGVRDSFTMASMAATTYRTYNSSEKSFKSRSKNLLKKDEDKD